VLIIMSDGREVKIVWLHWWRQGEVGGFVELVEFEETGD
jgi:hypothetical protein